MANNYNNNDDFRYEIVKSFGVLSTSSRNNWTKELNYVSWNGKPPKYDIRDWHPQHSKMGRGVTLTEDEFEKLAELAAAVYQQQGQGGLDPLSPEASSMSEVDSDMPYSSANLYDEIPA